MFWALELLGGKTVNTAALIRRGALYLYVCVWLSEFGHCDYNQKITGSNPRVSIVISPLGPSTRFLTPSNLQHRLTQPLAVHHFE